MILAEVLPLLSAPERLKIQNEKGKLLYCGYVGLLNYEKAAEDGVDGNADVIKLGYGSELNHKRWKELGLKEPIEPETVADISYSDLEQRLYFVITVSSKSLEAAGQYADQSALAPAT